MSNKPSPPSPTGHLDEVLRRGIALAEAGNAEAAEPYFRKAVELAPADPALLFNLGLTLSNLKRWDEAERFLTQAIAHGATGNAYIALGELLEGQKRHADAVRCFEALLATDPRKYQLHLKVGDLRGEMGDLAGQIASYDLALAERPGDAQGLVRLTSATLKKTEKLWSIDLNEAVRLEEALLARLDSQPRARVRVLRSLLVHKEWAERIHRGQAPYHAARVDELFFHHARHLLAELETTSERLLTSKTADDEARVSLAVARFCAGDRRGAEAIAKSLPDSVAGGLWETARFAPDFHEELARFSDDDLVRGLPEVIDVVSMPGNPNGIVYLSCNISYFIAFALPMVMSLRDRSPSTPVHLHIMDSPEELSGFISQLAKELSPLALAITVERPGLQQAPTMEARCYYHAIRFIRLYTHLRKYESPLWLMDVDAIVNRDLSALLERLPGSDVAVRIRPARLEPWNQFNACMVGANTTPASLAYFRQVAAYIAYFYQRKSLRWGIDQLAMYSVFADMEDRGAAPTLALLGERDVDYDQDEEGFVWPNSGSGKMGHMQRIAKPGAPLLSSLSTKFDHQFERYWQEAVRVASASGMKF